MQEPLWIREIEAVAMHDRQLFLFGGPARIRDRGLLQSALARPKNTLAYSETVPTLNRLAAAYAFGIASNHPFIDGNKRTALVVSFSFLDVNGFDVIATQEEAFLEILSLASGEVTEDQLAAWFDRNSAPR